MSQFKNRYAYCAVEAGKAFKEAAVQLMADAETALGGGKVIQYSPKRIDGRERKWG